MIDTLERPYRNVAELAEAIRQNEGGVMRTLHEEEGGASLITAVLAATNSDELSAYVHRVESKMAHQHASILWATQPHIYQASKSELREMETA